jgi:DNA repair protein RecN (Recombination protein N)
LLTELSITNFAIIDRLSLQFAPGLNVMTGETGAGKSIIIDAITAILGGKVGADFVRTGADSARIEAIFHLGEQLQAESTKHEEKADHVRALLSDQGIEWNEGELILCRDISRSGRSVCRLNGRAVTQSLLQQVGEQLIDIHGQTEHLSLLRVSEHVDFLDRFAGLLDLRAEVAARVATLRQLRKELSSVLQDERERARQMDLLRYQTEEITAAKLRPGEEEELLAERRILANAEQLISLASASYDAIQGAADRGRGALDALGEAVGALQGLAKVDETMLEHLEVGENLLYQLEDLARTLRVYRDNVEYDPARLTVVEERLDLLRALKRKYGSSVEEVLAYGREAAKELAELEHSEERVEALRVAEERLCQEIGELAGKLSAQRRKAGLDLARAIERELAELNMGKARFEVRIEQTESPAGVPVKIVAVTDEASTPSKDQVKPRHAGPSAEGQSPKATRGLNSGLRQSNDRGASCRDKGRHPSSAPSLTEDQVRRWEFDSTGIDRVEFFIAANPGEPLKPLAKVASGGETSRLMLAMKTVLSSADATPTLIFDEIDVGVGGRSGQVVGEKLWRLSSGHQVVCVTHLPQIAAFGDAHFRVTKIIGDRTSTDVQQLTAAARVSELAEMMGGETAKTHASAQEILQRANRLKLGVDMPPSVADPNAFSSSPEAE